MKSHASINNAVPPEKKSPRKASHLKDSAVTNHPQVSKNRANHVKKSKKSSPMKKVDKKGKAKSAKVSAPPESTMVPNKRSKSTKRTSEHEKQIVNEEPPAKKTKGTEVAKPVDMFDDIDIKKELIDEQFSGEMNIEVKREIEDDEDGGLNGSFRILGSLEFDLAQGSTIHLDDSGELFCDSQGDGSHHNDSHTDIENQSHDRDLNTEEQSDSLNATQSSVEVESQISVSHNSHNDSETEAQKDSQDESMNEMHNDKFDTSQNDTQTDKNDSLQNGMPDILNGNKSPDVKCLAQASNSNLKNTLKKRECGGGSDAVNGVNDKEVDEDTES